MIYLQYVYHFWVLYAFNELRDIDLFDVIGFWDCPGIGMMQMDCRLMSAMRHDFDNLAHPYTDYQISSTLQDIILNFRAIMRC